MNLSQETIQTAAISTLTTGSGIGIVAYLESHIGFYTLLFVFGNFLIGAILGTVTVRAKLLDTRLKIRRDAREQEIHVKTMAGQPLES